jgi:hypothetical protein
MSNNLLPGDGPNSGKGQFLVYEAEDGRVKIDVRLEDERSGSLNSFCPSSFRRPNRT